MEKLYREYLLDHYHNPQNLGKIENAEIRRHDINLSCGDEVEMFVKLDDSNKNMIKEVKFTGHGCVICMASSSILSEEISGKSLREVKEMNADSMLEMLRLKLTPTRIKCAMLPLVTIKKGILDYDSARIKQHAIEG
jgi:nitrogen fixation NifU-like protein